MSYTKIYIHAVWCTQYRKPYLYKSFREKIFDHMREYGRSKGIYIDIVNGYVQHVHCLISLNRDQNIADCMHLIKGESSYWINKEKFIGTKFRWQDDYYAVSIGISHLQNLRRYIKNQEAHHNKKRSFKDEEEEFLRRYQFLKQI